MLVGATAGGSKFGNLCSQSNGRRAAGSLLENVPNDLSTLISYRPGFQRIDKVLQHSVAAQSLEAVDKEHALSVRELVPWFAMTDIA